MIHTNNLQPGWWYAGLTDSIVRKSMERGVSAVIEDAVVALCDT